MCVCVKEILKMTALNVDQLDWKEKQLDVPTLNEVAGGEQFNVIIPE